MKMMDANEIIQFISDAKKSTPVKVYIKGKKLSSIEFSEGIQAFC